MRLIDADELIEDIKTKLWDLDTVDGITSSTVLKQTITDIDNAPTIDAVPVVRCKECKWWDKDTLRHNSNDVAEWDECECELLANRDRWNEIDRYCCDMHFCADGERKDDG